MKKTMIVLASLACTCPSPAEQVYLEPGQSFEKDGLSVFCRAPEIEEKPLTRTDCQHWDDFHQKCLFEQKRHLLGGLECLERCQHWDSFNSTCRYQTDCRYEKGQRVFVQTVCETYDIFRESCTKTKERLLSSAPPPQRK